MQPGMSNTASGEESWMPMVGRIRRTQANLVCAASPHTVSMVNSGPPDIPMFSCSPDRTVRSSLSSIE